MNDQDKKNIERTIKCLENLGYAVTETNDENNHTQTDEITCPWCNFKQSTWAERGSMECRRCDDWFSIKVKTTYTTTKGTYKEVNLKRDQMEQAK